MQGSTTVLTELLGSGPYPCEPGSKDFKELIQFSCGNSIAVLRPRVKTIPQNPGHTHSHDSFEFTIPLQGSPRLKIGPRILRLPEGMVLPCNPGTIHGPAEPIAEADFIAMQIRHNFMVDIGRALFGVDKLLFPEKPLEPGAELLDLIARFEGEICNALPGRPLLIDALEVMIAVTLLRMVRQAIPQPGNEQAAAALGIIRAMHVMEAHYSDDFNAEKLASYAHMSVKHFYRVFRSCTGQTPQTYLNEIRLQKAYDLLADTDLNITQICYQCGFVNHSHFSSCFKKKFGISPSAHRKKR